MKEWPKSPVACPRVLGMTMDLYGDTLAVLRTGSPVVTRCECRAPWSMRLPAFAGAGVHVVADGGCVLVPKDGRPLALVSGDLVFLRRGGQHTLCSDPALPPADYTHDRVAHGGAFGELRIDGPGKRTVLACAAYKLDVTSSHPLMGSLPDVIHFPASAERGQALEISIRQIIDETADPRATSASIVVALIDVLLLRILRAWHDKLPAEQATGWAAAVADPAIASALRAIHGSPAVSWTVETLARESGLSRAAFARRFNSVLGEPPLAYLTGWRMTTARRLLRETELPLSAIAERTGYGSEFAFAKAFKRESGRAPGSYRLAGAACPGRLPIDRDRRPEPLDQTRAADHIHATDGTGGASPPRPPPGRSRLAFWATSWTTASAGRAASSYARSA